MLEQLLAALARDANARARACLEDARAAAARIVAETLARGAVEGSERLERLREELRRSKEARLVEARRAATGVVLRAREAFLERVVAAARKLLPEAARSAAFTNSLPSLIQSALACLPGEDGTVRCSPAIRQSVARALTFPSGIEVRADSLVGSGLRIEDVGETVVIEATLEARLEQMDNDLRIEILRGVDQTP